MSYKFVYKSKLITFNFRFIINKFYHPNLQLKPKETNAISEFKPIQDDHLIDNYFILNTLICLFLKLEYFYSHYNGGAENQFSIE